ncbi:hypothetical protein [Maridesulfovibrio sp. FT414]|uniref:hypothetical protein n=1 Tax=Maridesulfovibrio sp. FT414 TaxID=2979469 RepID=UPI003D80348B
MTGTTDDDGNFNFDIPEEIKKSKSGMLIVLHASEGHRGEWTLQAEELFPGTTEAADEVKAEIESTPQAPSSTPVPSADMAALNKRLDDLNNKVDAVKRMLISQQEKGPGVHEIFSGIGYILGLFGIAAFFSSRKK